MRFVLGNAVDDAAFDPVDARRRRYIAERRLAFLRSPAERERLDQDDVRVPATSLEERPPLRRLGAHEVACEENRIESATEIEALDPCTHPLGVANVLEHLS